MGIWKHMLFQGILPDDKEYRDDVPEQLFEIKQDTLEIFEGL